MTIEFKKGRFIHGIWFVSNGLMDWMGCLFRDEGQPWKFIYRHRYYVDDKRFDSADRKSWYAVELKESSSLTDGEVAAHFHEMAAFVEKHMPGDRRATTEYVDIRMDSGEPEAIKKLQAASFATCKTVSTDEYEQMQKGEGA